VKGVVLAGGYGTRLEPMTRVVNKHLLDVFDQPMVHYPIDALRRAGIDEIVLVTGDEVEQFRTLLGDGSELGVRLTYARQDGAGGIADALRQAQPFVAGERIVAILGDNLYQDDLRPFVEAFREQPSGARILLKHVADARRFGVATVDRDRIVEILEKPADPPTDLAVTGCYMYDARVFEIIEGLQPSARGELEITDVNNAYVARGELRFDVLTGWWTDAGTPPSKLKASILVALTKGVTFHAERAPIFRASGEGPGRRSPIPCES
jgi:glucose-1-phosphate thymidylyltransferase